LSAAAAHHLQRFAPLKSLINKNTFLPNTEDLHHFGYLKGDYESDPNLAHGLIEMLAREIERSEPKMKELLCRVD
jgi:hypothetical protein